MKSYIQSIFSARLIVESDTGFVDFTYTLRTQRWDDYIYSQVIYITYTKSMSLEVLLMAFILHESR